MFSKKVILPFAALAIMGLVACGDDSSSSPAESSKELPSSVKTIEQAIHQTCTPTENFCAKIFVEEFSDTVQCNGKEFTPMVLGKPVEGCESAAPAVEDPVAGEGPAAGEEPAAGEGPAAGGNVVYCVVPGVMGGCEELPAEAAAMCETTLEGQLVEACPAE